MTTFQKALLTAAITLIGSVLYIAVAYIPSPVERRKEAELQCRRVAAELYIPEQEKRESAGCSGAANVYYNHSDQRCLYEIISACEGSGSMTLRDAYNGRIVLFGPAPMPLPGIDRDDWKSSRDEYFAKRQSLTNE